MELFLDVRFDIIWDYRELFLRGFRNTIILTLFGFSGGIILGLLFGIGKLSKRKWINLPARLYIDFFRGTPLLVQIFLIHLAIIPTLFGPQGAFVSGVVALILNSAAYIAEIFRAGIQSIDRGQMEAARSLGMPEGVAMRTIILPQAFRRMIPPLGNEWIALLKDTSLVAVIAANELLYASRIVIGAKYRTWEPLLTIAFVYLILTFIFSYIVSYLERRFSNTYIPNQRPWWNPFTKRRNNGRETR